MLVREYMRYRVSLRLLTARILPSSDGTMVISGDHGRDQSHPTTRYLCDDLGLGGRVNHSVGVSIQGLQISAAFV
jgi:hypothetical protein